MITRRMLKGLRILLVDDDVVFAESLRLVFGVHNEFFHVGSLGVLSTFLDKVAEPFDVVLLDKRLGKEDGFSAIARLRSDLPEASVLVLTADDDFHSIQNALSLGVCDYVQKRAQVAADLQIRIPVALSRSAVLKTDSSLSSSLPANKDQISKKFFRQSKEAWERRYLSHALHLCDGHAETAAKRLGLSRATMFKRMSELGIERRQWNRRTNKDGEICE